MKLPVVVGWGIALSSLLAIGARGADEPGSFSRPQSNYLLGCGGCHGYGGISNSRLVPTLKGLVGFYMNTADGRAYLARLPNVAFSVLNDAELAALLNYLVFDIGAGSVPAGVKPYDAAEVRGLRKRPLNEVSLVATRRGLVDTLIEHYHAPAALREYGDVDY